MMIPPCNSAQGHEPTPEPLTAEQVALPLALGADGVMVPFRPDAGTPRGKIRWREVKVGVLARVGQHRTRTGQVVTRLAQRRLVAVLDQRAHDVPVATQTRLSFDVILPLWGHRGPR
jgi:hypothetical protein